MLEKSAEADKLLEKYNLMLELGQEKINNQSMNLGNKLDDPFSGKDSNILESQV